MNHRDSQTGGAPSETIGNSVNPYEPIESQTSKPVAEYGNLIGRVIVIGFAGLILTSLVLIVLQTLWRVFLPS